MKRSIARILIILAVLAAIGVMMFPRVLEAIPLIAWRWRSGSGAWIQSEPGGSPSSPGFVMNEQVTSGWPTGFHTRWAINSSDLLTLNYDGSLGLHASTTFRNPCNDGELLWHQTLKRVYGCKTNAWYEVPFAYAAGVGVNISGAGVVSQATTGPAGFSYVSDGSGGVMLEPSAGPAQGYCVLTNINPPGTNACASYNCANGTIKNYNYYVVATIVHDAGPETLPWTQAFLQSVRATNGNLEIRLCNPTATSLSGQKTITVGWIAEIKDRP